MGERGLKGGGERGRLRGIGEILGRGLIWRGVNGENTHTPLTLNKNLAFLARKASAFAELFLEEGGLITSEGVEREG